MSASDPSFPGIHPDVEWRVLAMDDATDLLNLVTKLEDQDQALFRTSLAEVEEMLDRPGLAYVVGGISDNQLVCFGYVGLARSGSPEAICHGGVLPEIRNRGLGQDLLSWQTERGSALLAEHFPGQPCRITHAVDARRTAFHSHLESLGYQWTHSFAELRRGLGSPPRRGDLSSFIEIVQWSDEWEEQARRAFNRVSKQAGNQESQSAEQWTEARAHLVPGLSFLAVDRTGDRAKVVGLIEVGLYQQDWEALGWREGYIDTVAVFHPDSRTQILTSLLSSSLQAMSEAGLDKAAAGIDPQSDPEMMAFYESMGFEPHAWWRHYARAVAS
ncbi:MAG: hypothetical protein WAS54_01425 [Scrofimicrobium sp.]